MVVSQDSVDAASKFASKLARFELLSKRNLPFRHPDFSDDQIRQLTDIARSYRSTSSVASKRSSSRPHSGCSSPILSPTIQRLRADGFPALARCGSDPLLHAAPPQHAMNTGSLPADMMPTTTSPSPTPTTHHRHRREHRHPDAAAKDPGGGGAPCQVAGGGGAPCQVAGGGGGGKTSDRELLALLMNRLVAMETQLSHARQALKQRDFHIAVLEEKLRLYMKAEEDAVGSKMGFLETLKDTRMTTLEEKCLKLERQVMEMERFLGEYGMVWCEAEETYLLDNPVNASCSYSSSEATSPTQTPSHTPRNHPRVKIKRHRRNHKNREVRRVVAESTSRSISSEAEPFSLDYEKLLAAITELNIMAQGDAAAEAGESLQLTLYKNGIVADDGGFRSFEAVKTRQFLQDILDGFFPSELQDVYPQGIPIKVRDKRQVIFLPNSSRRKGAIRPPVPPKPRIPTIDSIPTASSLTSVTSMLFSSVSEAEARPVDQPISAETSDSAPPTAPVPETVGDTSRLCPEMDYRSESSDVSSRRNSLQRGSDKSEGEGIGRGEGGRRESELWRLAEVPPVPAVTAVRRDSRRESESRRGSDHRTHQCRRGSECRRSSELVRTTLDLDLGRRATSKHPLEWNRINRTAFLLNDDTFDSNGNHMRRGSVGVMGTDPYDMDSLRKRRTSVEDFLAKVPTCVVKNGKLVNLREEVADMLMGPSRKNSLTLVHTPALDEVGESQESNDQDTLVDNQGNDSDLLRPPPASTTTSHHDHTHSRTTLRIKVENGTETYLIKLKASDTLSTLRSYLRSYRGDHEEFDIVKTYPYKVLDQGEATMAELGLTPNAALHLKPAARPHPPESLSLQSSGAAVVITSTTSALAVTHTTNMSAAASTGIQTVSSAASPLIQVPRRVHSPALPQIPPNMHPDLPPTPVPILCFPDSQETASDMES
nr:uncharacterized protein LOC123756695 isoform X1 [Procambarus clarkii]